MDYGEFRRHIGKAGLTVNDFAGYMGVSPNSVSNYARRGNVPRTYAMLAVLMGDAADRGIDFQAILNRFSIYPHIKSQKVSTIPSRKQNKGLGEAGK
ncbi:hypothetical protein ATO7_06270 [Oceanococcus atlanticus]|uniref:Uncharacterized protein n=1 Tax=Oceanococcus atlanticus TaxID=1317117 RepID=A0A1Y1SIG1_9GAMM|nr:helix-turn-helix transcriptional regulator [Oceanococcus atlanticus]ORE89463.1 hypothetical protein ATO7_06270 [Oceanococcus atlanticus]